MSQPLDIDNIRTDAIAALGRGRQSELISHVRCSLLPALEELETVRRERDAAVERAKDLRVRLDQRTKTNNHLSKANKQLTAQINREKP